MGLMHSAKDLRRTGLVSSSGQLFVEQLNRQTNTLTLCWLFQIQGYSCEQEDMAPVLMELSF